MILSNGFSLPFKKLLCCVLAGTVLALSCFCSFKLAVSADNQTALSDNSVFSDDFNGTGLNEAWKRQQTADGYDCSVSSGSIKFAKQNYVRSAVYLDGAEYQKLNQRAAIDFVSENGKKQVLWLRFGSYGDQSKSRGSLCRGYYIQYASGGQEIFIRRWVNVNNQNVMHDVIGSFGWNRVISNGVKCRMELVATGSSPTLLTAKIYTFDEAKQAWKTVFSNSYIDNTPELQQKGTCAISSDGSPNVAIDAAEYSSTDNVEGNYYVQKTSNCRNGVYSTFGQVVTLEPGKEYVFSARRKTAEKQATLWIEYSKDENGKITNDTRLLTDIGSCETDTIGGYNKLTCKFRLPSAGIENNNTYCWVKNSQKSGRARVIVGFRIDGEEKTGTFTHFEIYAADDEQKTNLIVNPDFKMGLYGWDDNFGTSSYAAWYPCAEGAALSANERVEVVSADNEKYEEIFGVPKVREPMTFLPNAYSRLTNDRKLNIGYLGGSVTSGYGASNQETASWRGLTTSWFRTNFPDAEISAFNAAVGSTGSYSAAFRYQREVAPKSPDVLFIEFAVNDYYDKLTYAQSLRAAESVVRAAYEYNPFAEIVVILTADKWCRTEEYDCYRALKNIAEAYDLMCIDIRKDFLAGLSDAEYANYMCNSSDGVHPNDAGYAKYFELIREKLERDIILESPKTVEMKSKKLPASNISSEPLMMNGDSVRPDVIQLESNTGWQVKNETFSTLGDRGYASVLTASQPGSEFSFNFFGTDIGLFIGRGSDCGKISVTVDNGTPVIIDSYRANSNHGIAICGWNLLEKQHSVKVRLLSEKNAESGGTAFTIGAFLLNTTPTVDPGKNYMVQNMGLRDYGKFGQVFKLDKNGRYSYSVSYKYLNQNESKPIIMYKTSAGSAFRQLTSFTVSENEEYYRNTYEFTIPDDAYDTDGGKAEIMVGYTYGRKNSSGYFYNFELYDLSDGSKTNLFVNPLFKQGFKGWTGDSLGYTPVDAEGEFTFGGGDAKIKPADENIFKKKTLSGKYMVHNTGKTNYMKFGQLFEVEPGSSYELTCLVKYMKPSSCAPIALYFRKSDPNTHYVINWKEAIDDKDHSSFAGKFTVPDDANVLANGKVELFVGYTTGAVGADAYFADFVLYNTADETKTNMFANADFKFGLLHWRCAPRVAPVNEYGILTFSNNSSELLPYTPSLFINDSNDHFIDDGDWYSQFGEDENFETWMKRVGAYYEKTEHSGEDGEWITTTTEKWIEGNSGGGEAEPIIKRRLKRKAVTVYDDYTLVIILSCTGAVLIAGAVTFIIVYKKKKKKADLR